MGRAERSGEVLILKPSQADCMNFTFEEYVTKHEKAILDRGGVCKIVMPASLTPRKSGYGNLQDITISRAIKQEAVGAKGMYRMVYVEQKPMTFTEFKAMAEDRHNCPTTSGEGRAGNSDDMDDLERKFWKNVGIRPPLYGADVAGSLFDEKAKGWNLRHLDTLLSKVLEESGFKLPGVNTPYLYFGQWRSTFAWHTEDLDLYSVNYLHFGAPKQWYVIHPDHSARFEAVIKAQVPEVFKICPEFLRHKELLVSPQFLEQYQIPYMRLLQHPREFVVTYPGAYHAGFNHGFNCAESVNFATKRWIPIGARAGVCECQPDAVKIDMRLFRHLVPARQLPQELLVDTSDEESESGSSDADSSEEGEEEEESDSEDSATETLVSAENYRKRPRSSATPSRTKAATKTSAAPSQPARKRSRAAGDADISKAASKARAAAQLAQQQQQQKERRAAAQAMLGQAQAQARGRRAAVRSGRPSVRERIMLRVAEATAAAAATRRTTRSPVASPRNRTGPGAPGRGTRVLQRPAPAPLSSPIAAQPAPARTAGTISIRDAATQLASRSQRASTRAARSSPPPVSPARKAQDAMQSGPSATGVAVNDAPLPSTAAPGPEQEQQPAIAFASSHLHSAAPHDHRTAGCSAHGCVHTSHGAAAAAHHAPQSLSTDTGDNNNAPTDAHRAVMTRNSDDNNSAMPEPLDTTHQLFKHQHTATKPLSTLTLPPFSAATTSKMTSPSTSPVGRSPKPAEKEPAKVRVTPSPQVADASPSRPRRATAGVNSWLTGGRFELGDTSRIAGWH